MDYSSIQKTNSVNEVNPFGFTLGLHVPRVWTSIMMQFVLGSSYGLISIRCRFSHFLCFRELGLGDKSRWQRVIKADALYQWLLLRNFLLSYFLDETLWLLRQWRYSLQHQDLTNLGILKSDCHHLIILPQTELKYTTDSSVLFELINYVRRFCSFFFLFSDFCYVS